MEYTLKDVFCCAYGGFIDYLRLEGADLSFLYDNRINLSSICKNAVHRIEYKWSEKRQNGGVVNVPYASGDNRQLVVATKELMCIALQSNLIPFATHSKAEIIEEAICKIMRKIVEHKENGWLAPRLVQPRRNLIDILSTIGIMASNQYLSESASAWDKSWGDQSAAMHDTIGFEIAQSAWSPFQEKERYYASIDPFEANGVSYVEQLKTIAIKHGVSMARDSDNVDIQRRARIAAKESMKEYAMQRSCEIVFPPIENVIGNRP